MMDMKKVIAVSAVAVVCIMSLVCCAPSASSAGYDELSADDVVFSRATVTYLKDVTYGEHMDRSDCWFFINGSANETAFVNYVSKRTDAVPTADDRSELDKDPTKKCNVYNLGLKPKFNVYAPLVTADYIYVTVKAGQRLSVEMNADVGVGFYVTDTASSDVSSWSYGRLYITTAEKDTEYSIFPDNEAFNGGTISIKDLYTTVSYDVSVSSGSASNGNNVVIAVILFIIGAAVIAVIILCSKKISWAKNAVEPGEIQEGPDNEQEIKEQK